MQSTIDNEIDHSVEADQFSTKKNLKEAILSLEEELSDMGVYEVALKGSSAAKSLSLEIIIDLSMKLQSNDTADLLFKISGISGVTEDSVKEIAIDMWADGNLSHLSGPASADVLKARIMEALEL